MNPLDLKLQNAWEGYAVLVIPNDAPQAQRSAMYQAFLAGATTVVQLYQALEQQAPSNVRTGMQSFGQQVLEELQRIGQAPNG